MNEAPNLSCWHDLCRAGVGMVRQGHHAWLGWAHPLSLGYHSTSPRHPFSLLGLVLSSNAGLCCFPLGCMGLVQLVDIGYNKSFKAKVKDQYIKWLIPQDADKPILKSTCHDLHSGGKHHRQNHQKRVAQDGLRNFFLWLLFRIESDCVWHCLGLNGKIYLLSFFHIDLTA